MSGELAVTFVIDQAFSIVTIGPNDKLPSDPDLESVDFTHICKIRRSASHELSTQILFN